MGLKYDSKKSNNMPPMPSGNYVAICTLVADLGLQPGSAKYPDPKYQVYINFEIPSERVQYKDKDGNDKEGPRVIGNAFTASMGKKANLRKHLEAWRGAPFTDEEASNFYIGALLGKPCMLNVIHNTSGEKVYANIGSITPIPKGFPAPKAETPLMIYDGDDINTHVNLAKLPQWIQDKIKNPAKQEYSHATGVYAEEQAQETREYDFNQSPTPSNPYADQMITDDDIPF